MLRHICLLITLAACFMPLYSNAQSVPLRTGEPISLQKQLETGLLARRPQEFAYIKRVVVLVETNQLPRQLVIETFDWARNKRPRYPIVYFAKALQVRAARVGIRVPALTAA